ncbi:von Willebrand factor type A domain protein, partial [Cooperia oncophora]
LVFKDEIHTFRELELYAGDKTRVYIDARVRQFLDETSGEGVTHCRRSVLKSASSSCRSVFVQASSVVLQAPKSCSAIVDLLIVLDTSTPSQSFYQEKQLAIDLLKALPANVFERRLAVSIITFASNSTVLLPLGLQPKEEIVFELERVAHSTGPASLTGAAVSTIAEIKSHRRKGSRALVIIVSNGNGGEERWKNVLVNLKPLHLKYFQNHQSQNEMKCCIQQVSSLEVFFHVCQQRRIIVYPVHFDYRREVVFSGLF